MITNEQYQEILISFKKEIEDVRQKYISVNLKIALADKSVDIMQIIKSAGISV